VIDLRRHVPRVALDWDDVAPGRSWQVLDATMVFADISGFTALTERLAKRGRIGAEELIETLNRVFGAMLSQAAIRDGELLKFGGDALLFLFRGQDHQARACRSAVDMRQALKEAARVPTSVGRLKLSMSVGIHSGPVDLFLVGAPTRELLILGTAGTSTAEAEHAAVAGQILVTEGTAQHLPKGSTERREDGLHRLKWRFTYPPEGEGPPTPQVSEERLRTLFPHALGEYLADAVPDPEHKVATIGFARFSGTDSLLVNHGHDAVADALHRTMSAFEEAIIAEGITMLATDLDSDGGKLFMGSGVPYSTEDDEGRMLRAMRHVLDVGTPLPVQIGVNRGHVFAAEVGTPNRSAYSAMGDTTNTAARIMSKAPAGVLFVHPSVLEHSRTLFATTPAGPFAMKGKIVPVPVYDLGAELGTREAHARSELPLLGREEELSTLRNALVEALSGTGGLITVAGSSGLGKSRLISEALKGLDATVVTVRAEPYGMTSPYRMLRDPVRAALRMERGEPGDMYAAFLASYTRLMPDLLPMAPLLEDVVNVSIPMTLEAAAIEPQFRPERISDVILRLIEATVPRRFVLLVEEGHWADAASITVLRRIGQAVAGRPWAVVVARRTDGEGLELDEGTRVELEPLPPEVMRRFVIEATHDAPLREHEIDGLVTRAQGNPLFVEELLRVFRDVGSLDDVPESLHAALDAQIDALDPHTRRILRYSSVLGRSFRRVVLNETLNQEGLDVDQATLDRMSKYLEPDGRDRLRFRNSMIRDAAYEGLAFRLRTKLHGAAGRAVETLSTDLDADADTLSLHFWRAGEASKTWVYARMAGDRAAHAYANVDAAVQYQRALDSARALHDTSTSEILALLRRLGEVRELAGLYAEASAALREAIRLVAGDRHGQVDIMVQRARTRQRAGDYRTALREITQAEKVLAGDSSEAARHLIVRLRSIRVVIRAEQERHADAMAEAERLIDAARTSREWEALAQALMVLDVSRFILGDSAVGQNTREALAICLEHGQLQRAYRAHNNLGGFALFTGHWNEAVEAWSGARTTALAIGDDLGAAQVAMGLGEILVNQGQYDQAEAVLQEAVRVLRSAGVHAFAANGEIHLARIEVARGDYEAAERRLEGAELELAALGQSSSSLEAALVRAEALTRGGRVDDALTLLAATAGASVDDVLLIPRRSLEEGRALFDRGRLAEARETLTQGLADARSYGLPLEEARLLQMIAALEAADGHEAARAEAADAAAQILQRLGAVTV